MRIIAIHNTDDHLRNLGLLRVNGAWVLSPVFDININPDLSHPRVTAVYGEAGKHVADALWDFAEVCDVSREEASSIVRTTVRAARQCEGFARKNGCKQSEIRLLGGAVEASCTVLAHAFDL